MIHIQTIVLLATTTFAGPAKIEVSVYKDCEKVPSHLIESCKQNKGGNAPYTYYRIGKSSDCNGFSDSVEMRRCKEEVGGEMAFYFDGIAGYDADRAEAIAPNPDEVAAKSLKTLVVLTAINTGVLVAGIVAGVVMFLMN